MLEESPAQVSSILMNIAGPASLSALEIKEAIRTLTEACSPTTNIFYAYMHDNNVDNEVTVTLVCLFERYEFNSKPEPPDPYRGNRPAFPYYK